MERGNYYLNRRHQQSLVQDFANARQYFLQARDTLKSTNPSDFVAFVRVYYKLTNVELDMSHNRKLSLEEKEEHVRNAEEYVDLACEVAVRSLRASDVAEMKLERAVLKARKAELKARRADGLQEACRLKDKALRGMDEALQDLQDIDYVNIRASRDWAVDWRVRLEQLNI
jgi:hypothetical protein